MTAVSVVGLLYAERNGVGYLKGAHAVIMQAVSTRARRAAISFRFAALALALLPCGSAPAGNTWDGGSTVNDYWTTGANWNSSGPPFNFQFPPVNNGTADIVMPAVTGLVQTPIVDIPYSIDSLRFTNDNGNGRFVILAVEELTIGPNGVRNNDSDLQSVFGSVRLAANQHWDAASGPLQMDFVNLNGRQLNLEGAYPIDMMNSIVGTEINSSLSVADNYTSTVTILGSGSNTYAGNTNVYGGTMLLQKSGGATAVPGDLSIALGGTVRLGANEQISEAAGNSAIVSSTGLLDVNTRTESLAFFELYYGGTATVAATGKLTAAEAIVIGSTSNWTNAGSLYIGDSTNGTLDIVDGGDVSSATGYIADDTGVTGEVLVYQTGSTWTNSGYLNVGQRGNGTLDITAGGDVSSGNGYIGNYPDSMGHVTVDGLGSTWTNGLYLVVASSGAGTLGITNQGQVSNVYAIIGLNAGSTGEVTVDGANSKWQMTSGIEVGNRGDANLEIINGGSVSTLAGVIGYYGGSMGSVTVDGMGSTWTNTGNLHVGNEGDGSLHISAGGDVTNAIGYIGDDNGSTGEVTVDGIGSSWTNSGVVYVGRQGNGRLDITAGGAVSNIAGHIGAEAGSTGSVTVDGAGSTWTNSQSLIIGSAGPGTLDVTNGGQVNSTFGYIGDLTGSSRVTVDGAASTWTNTANLEVGSNNGFGTFEVTGGGHVTSVIGFVGKYDRHGAAIVDGAGSLWTNSSYLHVSAYGDATLDITGGGQVTNTDAYIGWFSDDKMGQVTVDGAGSTWTSTGDAWIGRGAAYGKLLITGGGHATSANGYIGYGDDSSGDVTVSGTGSTWTISGDLYVSIDFDPGAATLTVSDNGSVSASQVIIAPEGEIHGDGNIVGFVQNAGLVSPGTSPGALSIEGDYTQTAAGELLIELASDSYDQLLVTDNATLAGTLTVNLINGFTPSVGQSFTILTADDVDDAFTTTALPSLLNLEFDVVYNAQSVVLRVVPSLPGDFNVNGIVDAADYVVWRKAPGFTASDYNIWRENFGEISAGSGTGSSRTVPSHLAAPEPGALSMVLGAAAICVLVRRGGKVSRWYGCSLIASAWSTYWAALCEYRVSVAVRGESRSSSGRARRIIRRRLLPTAAAVR